MFMTESMSFGFVGVSGTRGPRIPRPGQPSATWCHPPQDEKGSSPRRRCSGPQSVAPEYPRSPMIHGIQVPGRKCSGRCLVTPEHPSPSTIRRAKFQERVLGAACGSSRALGSPRVRVRVLRRECSWLHIAAPEHSVPRRVEQECSGDSARGGEQYPRAPGTPKTKIGIPGRECSGR